MTRTRTASWLTAVALLAAPALAGSAAASGGDAALLSELEQAEAEEAELGAPSDVQEPADLEEPAMENGHVARATFTTAVEQREPVDEVKQLPNDATQVLFFTDLRNLQGQTVTHVWEHDGKVVAKVPFHVGAPRWRVYSSKNLEPSWTGEWTVKVVDATGQVIHAEYFDYVAATGPGDDAAAESMPASMPME